VAVPVGPMRITGSPGRSARKQVARAAHLQHDGGDEPLLAVDPGAGEREALHRESRAFHLRGEGLEILQAEELARLELHGGLRRVQHHLDDVRREALDVVHAHAQQRIQPLEERGGIGGGAGRAALQHAAHDGIAQFRRPHRLHHVAGERGMQVAEEAHVAIPAVAREQHVRRAGFEERSGCRVAFVVHRAK